jgi:hypothetical protein
VYDQLHADARTCSIMLLAAKLKRFLVHDVSLSIMQQCVASLYTSQSILYHCITHKVQNTRHALRVTQEYLQYIDAQFLEGSYHRSSIVNIDSERNIISI